MEFIILFRQHFGLGQAVSIDSVVVNWPSGIEQAVYTPAINQFLTIVEDAVCLVEGDACNDNNDCTINDVYNAACNCVGTFQDADNDGVCDAEDDTNWRLYL